MLRAGVAQFFVCTPACDILGVHLLETYMSVCVVPLVPLCSKSKTTLRPQPPVASPVTVAKILQFCRLVWFYTDYEHFRSRC